MVITRCLLAENGVDQDALNPYDHHFDSTKVEWRDHVKLYRNESDFAKMILPTNSKLIEADDRLASVFSHLYFVQHGAQATSVKQQFLSN